jgi:hypothetical protein
MLIKILYNKLLFGRATSQLASCTEPSRAGSLFSRARKTGSARARLERRAGPSRAELLRARASSSSSSFFSSPSPSHLQNPTALPASTTKHEIGKSIPPAYSSLTNIRGPHGSHPQAPRLVRRHQRRPPPLPPPRGPRPPPRRQAPPWESRRPPAPSLIAGSGAGVPLIASSCGWRRRGHRGRAVLHARLEAARAPVPAAEEARGGQVCGALRSAASQHRSAHRGGY